MSEFDDEDQDADELAENEFDFRQDEQFKYVRSIGIQRAVFSVEHADENESYLERDRTIKELLDCKVRDGYGQVTFEFPDLEIDRNEDRLVTLNNPKWIDLLRAFDEFLIKNDIHDHIYLEDVDFDAESGHYTVIVGS